MHFSVYRPACVDSRPLPARVPGLAAGGAGRVRHQRPQRVHVHQGAEGEEDDCQEVQGQIPLFEEKPRY